MYRLIVRSSNPDSSYTNWSRDYHTLDELLKGIECSIKFFSEKLQDKCSLLIEIIK